MFDAQWDKLIKVEEEQGVDPALALIYQWVKTNVISKPDFIRMVKYVLEDDPSYSC